jgi:hypothetical protein
MSFSAWSVMPCTQSTKRRVGGYMRISASIHDVAEQMRNSCKTQGCIMTVIRSRSHLVGAWHTMAMLCRVAGIWNEQGNDCVGWTSGILTTSGFNVTSCSNENPSITHFLRLHTSSNTPSIPKEYYNLVLLPLHKGMTLSILQILVWEVPGQTGTNQGEVAI